MSSTPVKDLSITVFYEGESHEINTYANEYRSLMMLIYDKIYTESFGECLGMGKCGTCMVEIISSDHPLSLYQRNEDTTLFKSGYANSNIHLSCQVMIDEAINGLKVNVLI